MATRGSREAAASKAANALGEIFIPFIEKRPLAVMARGLLERMLGGRWIDDTFKEMADKQYTRQILFSALVGLMLRVVLRTAKSVRGAFRMEKIAASLSAVYLKLQGIEPGVCAALARGAAMQLEELCDALGVRQAALVEGRCVRVLDGNALEKSQHRIKELRTLAAGALPGKSLVVYDPSIDGILHVIPCEDGHAQERSLLDHVLAIVDRAELWIGDRNFCVFSFLHGISGQQAEFIIRHHRQLPLYAMGKERQVGKVDGSRVTEQKLSVRDDAGRQLQLRCVRVYRDRPTRDGDKVLVLLTNLARAQVSAVRVADLYRRRWTIETAFQKLERDLNSEINTLGYPRAALFAFVVATIAYNAMSAVQAALRAGHGNTFVDEELSHYELAAQIEGPYEGMIVAIPDNRWQIFRDLEIKPFVALLIHLAGCADLERLRKAKYSRRNKPPTKRIYDPARPHVSTARILAARNRRLP